MIRFACIIMAAFAVCAAALPAAAAGEEYVGSAKCVGCHEKHDENYKLFQQYSKKAHSAKGVKKMLPKLTEEEKKACYSCHTTGYGKPGGFVSYERTPGLGDVGCETCHGPGSAHVESGDPALIVKTPARDSCLACHNNERVKNFNFKPLIHSGAH